MQLCQLCGLCRSGCSEPYRCHSSLVDCSMHGHCPLGKYNGVKYRRRCARFPGAPKALTHRGSPGPCTRLRLRRSAVASGANSERNTVRASGFREGLTKARSAPRPFTPHTTALVIRQHAAGESPATQSWPSPTHRSAEWLPPAPVPRTPSSLVHLNGPTHIPSMSSLGDTGRGFCQFLICLVTERRKQDSHEPVTGPGRTQCTDRLWRR